jgi:hypothetical protein
LVGAPKVTVRGGHVRIGPSAEQRWTVVVVAAFSAFWFGAAALIARSSWGLGMDWVAVGIALGVAILSLCGAVWMILRAGAVQWCTEERPALVQIRWGMWPFVHTVLCPADRLRAGLAMVDGAAMPHLTEPDTGAAALSLVRADGGGEPVRITWVRRRERLLPAADALREIMPVDDRTFTTVTAPDGTAIPVAHTRAAWTASSTMDFRLRTISDRQWELVPTVARWTTSALIAGFGALGVALLIGIRASRPVENVGVFYSLLAVSSLICLAGLLTFAARYSARSNGTTISIRERNPLLLRRRSRTLPVDDVAAVQIAAWVPPVSKGLGPYFELNLVLRPAGERINLLASKARAAIYEDARLLSEHIDRPLIDSTAAGRRGQKHGTRS